MKRLITFVGLPLLLMSGLTACSRQVRKETVAAPPAEEEALSTARLVMSEAAGAFSSGALSGEIVLELAPGWHTYGDPPGDSGMPPMVDFRLPPGWQAVLGELPPTQRFEDEAGVTFGYEGELRIPFRLEWPSGATAGEAVEIEVNVQWLICKDICLPQSALLKAKIVPAD
jgi:thiol:disulfide interchange protein DsbD